MAVHQRPIAADPEQVNAIRSLRTAVRPSTGSLCYVHSERLNTNRHPLSARIRYAFDNYMARGTIALILGLFVLSLLVIMVVSGIVWIFGLLNENSATQGLGFFEAVWRSPAANSGPRHHGR